MVGSEPNAGTPGQSREAGFRTVRLIAASMPMGVALFYAVALYLTDGGARGIGPELIEPRVAVLAWTVLAVGSLAAALVFRGRALRAVEEAQRRGGADAVARQAAIVQTNLIIAWGLLEAPALLAGVIALLLGEEQLLWYAGLLYAVGLVLTFPRAEWFGVDPRTG